MELLKEKELATPSSPYKRPMTAKPIGGVIEKVMKSLGLLSEFYGWQVVRHWPELVGEQLARRCRPVRYADGTLFVAVEDPVWRQEISLRAGDMLENIHSYPYGRAIKRIQLLKRERKASRYDHRGY
jgi:hypothetical protein